MDASTRAILIKSDRLGQWEFPSDADGDIWGMIESLLPSVESVVGRSLDLDRNVQDASFLTDIGLLDDRYYDRKRGVGCIRYVCAFRFSNFGRMFTLHGEQWRHVFDKYRLGEAIELIRSNGFVYVPADQLEAPYDGVNSSNNPIDGSSLTWWIRFFDYI